jgi:tRNA threonylcarbamoyladenosine biosynthesis protein TsaE
MTSSIDPRSGAEETFFLPSAIDLGVLGECLGQVALPGLLLLLSGAMGSGKTTLAAGVARGMGISGRIASPTFLYVQSYPAPLSPPGLPLLHADWDRVSSQSEDLEEALVEGASERVTLVEWGEKLPASLVAVFPLRLHLHLSIPEGQEGRLLRILWASESAKREGLTRFRENFRRLLEIEPPSLRTPKASETHDPFHGRI